MFQFLKRAWKTIVSWFRPDSGGSAAPPPVATCKESLQVQPPAPPPTEGSDSAAIIGLLEQCLQRTKDDNAPPPPPAAPDSKPSPPESKPEAPESTPEAPDLQPVPAPPPPPPAPAPVEPPTKWLKPKGTEHLVQHHARPEQPKRERTKAKPKREPTEPVENPEQWGQYYFRDAILDQLDQYFLYLKRMKERDRSCYELHRRLGIQVMPASALRTFDEWRQQGSLRELDAWFKEHRPAFGAVSYGIDRDSLDKEKIFIVDCSPEQMKAMKEAGDDVDAGMGRKNSAFYITRGRNTTLPDGKPIETGILWVPRFLYFHKYDRPPPDVQKVIDGDVYLMTIYWDRLDDHAGRWHKTVGKKGGVPQDYAVCVEKETGQVRVLKMLLHEHVKVRARHGHDRGSMFSIPNTHWGIPIDKLQWARHSSMSPEDTLKSYFIQAAMMYESAALGSMIRIEASKKNLTATFGVEIKRTAYFFKDRDITAAALTERGTRKPIFHIVRPHVRHTKKGDVPVKMHFSGLKEFEWAGYHISITVPGRDHFHLPEFNVGADWQAFGQKTPQGYIDSSGIGQRLHTQIREGFGGIAPKHDHRKAD